MRAFLSDDGTRFVGWYRAPDAEAVRFVMQQQGTPEAPVWPTDADVAPEPDPSDLGRSRVALEIRTEAAGGPGAAAAHEALRSALAGAGLPPARVLGARTGACVVGLVDGDDVAAVERCLRSAGLAPAAVWPCIELDPEPPRLFESAEPPAATAPTRPGVASSPDTLDAVVIGAGLSGLCALHRLRSMGLRVRLYEAGSDVGGVWHWNRYPGARVDSESYTYAFSFSPEVRAPTSGCWSPGSRTCSSSTALRTPPHCATPDGRSSTTSTGSRGASSTCAPAA